MQFDLRETDLAKLNSLTKYPSIPTYHALDPKNGSLLEQVTAFPDSVIGTEKIDGTNARLIFLPDGNYLLGSREELLYARGDLIGNPALGIVAALKSLAEALNGLQVNTITVYYVEVYGGKVTAAGKQYTSDRQVSYRLFDIMQLADYAPLPAQTPQQLSTWRENGGQPFLPEVELQAASAQHAVPLTPRLFQLAGGDLPAGIAEMHGFLQQHLPESRSRLDVQAGGKPEGIVLRAPDRAVIAKARFDDYTRTLKRLGR